MEEKLGIEKTKEVLGTFLDVGIMAYKSYANDKKLSTGEVVKLVMKVPAVWKAIKNIDDAIPEVKDIDPIELDELMQFVIGKLQEIKAIAEKE